MRRAVVASVMSVAVCLAAGAAAALPDDGHLAGGPGARDVDPGQEVYVASCAACHMPAGTGIPGAFPPLAGSRWVEGDERMIVRIVLQGLTGEIEVDGETYSGLMPPLGATLSDAQIAAVATYVRRNWGNAAPAVTAATVARERAATSGRTTPWTVPELMAGLETVK